jgi:hypothetical protein
MHNENHRKKSGLRRANSAEKVLREIAAGQINIDTALRALRIVGDVPARGYIPMGRGCTISCITMGYYMV